MEAFPSIAACTERTWRVGEGKIHHGCCWCRDYTHVYKALNYPRGRKNILRQSVEEESSPHAAKKQRCV